MRLRATALLAALLLVGCGGGPTAPADAVGADPEVTLRTWSDAMSTGDWPRVLELSCAAIDPEFSSADDQSTAALLDAASVRFELLQIEPAVITDDTAEILTLARYHLALDSARLRASLGDALRAAGAPSAEIDTLATQAVEFIVAGARGVLEDQLLDEKIPLVLEEGAWRVCLPGFSPLTLALPNGG